MTWAPKGPGGTPASDRKFKGYPVTPADADYERMRLVANMSLFAVVQVSERKYQIGERRSIRASSKQIVVPYYKLRPERYTWFDALAECERLQEIENNARG